MARFIKTGPFLATIAAFSSFSHAQNLPSLPPAPSLPPFRWFASTDPKHKNDDYFLLAPGQTRRVPLAAGTLERLWSTSLFPDQTELVLEAGKNRRQVLWSGGKARRGLLSDKTFTFFPSVASDPLAKLEAGAALIATNNAKTPSKWYFQAAVRPKLAVGASPKPKSVARRIFKLQLAPGESQTVEKWDSPGQITEFSVASNGADAQVFRDLHLKISFEDQTAVDAPLLSLAGAEAGTENFHNAVADFTGSRLVLRWPMPFEKARISLENAGQKPLQIEASARVSAFVTAPSSYRFCALHRSKGTTQNEPVEILKVQGQGAFVGLSLLIAPGEAANRRTFAYLEGNESILADGQNFEGTGTEDFFSSAWYYPDKPFFHAFEGMTEKVAAPPSVSAYRWMIPDAIPFKKSLQFDFEHGNANNTEGINWTWTAIWYQKSPLPIFDTLPDAGRSAPDNGSSTAPQNDRWKLFVAVGAGVILGLFSALVRRRSRKIPG